MKKCPWCSTKEQEIYHWPCPKIEEIEYFENGNVKRIKFNNPIIYTYQTYPFTSTTVTWSSS